MHPARAGGTSFDIDGVPVAGRAYFLKTSTRSTPLTSPQILDICASANGTAIGSCNRMVIEEAQEMHPIPCGAMVTIPRGEAACQETLKFFAEAFSCNQTENFEEAPTRYNDCYPPWEDSQGTRVARG
jgi:hypothetical protein